MKRPIQAGDKCIVVNGLGQNKSPNLGLTVTVKSREGEHSRFGVIWLCEGPGIKQLTDAGTYQTTGWAGFPAAWLQRIEPDATTKLKEDAYETNI